MGFHTDGICGLFFFFSDLNLEEIVHFKPGKGVNWAGSITLLMAETNECKWKNEGCLCMKDLKTLQSFVGTDSMWAWYKTATKENPAEC